MSLVDVSSGKYRYHISCQSNDELDDTIYTYLKTQSKASPKSGIINIDTRAKYEKALDYIPMWPLDGDYWFIKVDVKSLGQLSETAVKTLMKFETCIVWFSCSHYGQYKQIKELFKNGSLGLNEMYFSRLSYDDIGLILSKHEDKFSPALRKFLTEEYRGDVMAPYKIRDLIESDVDIESTRDIIKLLGISDRNIRQYAYRLLSINMNTTRVAVSRNKLVQSAVSFIGSISPLELRRNLLVEVERILHTKMIHQTGTLVDVLPVKYLFQYPDLFNFDKKAAKKIVVGLYEDAGDQMVTENDKVQAIKDNIHPRSRMAKWEIQNKIPGLSLQRIQRLYLAIQGTTENYEWYSVLNVMEFVHSWISQEVRLLNEKPNGIPEVEILKLGR